MSTEVLQRSHAPEYMAEFLGTAAMVFFGLSAVVFNFSPQLPMAHWLPDHGWRLLLTGIMFASSGSLVAISPLGRLSGGHINPCVTLAFWAYGKMCFRDFVGYIAAQMLGGVAGAALLAGVWKRYAAEIGNGMTLPGQGWTIKEAFFGEVISTGLLVLMIFICVSSRRLMRWTPLMTMLLVAALVSVEAPISGTSLNPARSFGPALVSGVWRAQWLYFVAPPLGAVAGLLVFYLGSREGRTLLTGKLFHVRNYRSLFKGDIRPPDKLSRMER